MQFYAQKQTKEKKMKGSLKGKYKIERKQKTRRQIKQKKKTNTELRFQCVPFLLVRRNLHQPTLTHPRLQEIQRRENSIVLLSPFIFHLEFFKDFFSFHFVWNNFTSNLRYFFTHSSFVFNTLILFFIIIIIVVFLVFLLFLFDFWRPFSSAPLLTPFSRLTAERPTSTAIQLTSLLLYTSSTNSFQPLWWNNESKPR